MTGDSLIWPAASRDLPALLARSTQLYPGASDLAPEDAARILDEFSHCPGSAVLMAKASASPPWSETSIVLAM